MKSILNFFLNFFGTESKNDYIGLSAFKTNEIKTETSKAPVKNVERTALTGLLKRVG